MITWFKLKCSHSDEYETLRKRVREAELRIDDLEAFQTNVRNMARKVQTRRARDEDEAEPQDIRSSVLVPV